MDCACISILLEFGNALGDANSGVSQWCHMRPALTIRLTDKLLAWLKEMSRRTGLPVGRIIRHQLEPAKAGKRNHGFQDFAGKINGPSDLSSREGFSVDEAIIIPASSRRSAPPTRYSDHCRQRGFPGVPTQQT